MAHLKNSILFYFVFDTFKYFYHWKWFRYMIFGQDSVLNVLNKNFLSLSYDYIFPV